MCVVLLPQGDNPITVNKYIILYTQKSWGSSAHIANKIRARWWWNHEKIFVFSKAFILSLVGFTHPIQQVTEALSYGIEEPRHEIHNSPF